MTLLEDKLNAAAVKLQEQINEAVPEETRTKIQGAVEHLQVQLALGAADSRDAYNAKKKEVTRAIAEFDAADAAAEREAAEDVNALMEIYVAQAVILNVELEAMEEQYEEEGAQDT